MPYYLTRPVEVHAERYYHDYLPDAGAGTFGRFRELPLEEAGLASYRLEIAYWDCGKVVLAHAREGDWVVSFADGRVLVYTHRDFQDTFMSPEEDDAEEVGVED